MIQTNYVSESWGLTLQGKYEGRMISEDHDVSCYWFMRTQIGDTVIFK